MNRYSLTDQANSDLDSIADYIGIVNDNPTARGTR
jgi:plasmid stabilization system protein ParE